MAKIYYARLDEFWRKEQKYQFLEEKQHIYNIEWQEITPDAKHNWLTAGMHDEFETFLPLGTKEAKADKRAEVETIFKTYSRGIETAKDAWLYNFNQQTLIENVVLIIDTFNEQIRRWNEKKRDKKELDGFVLYDDRKIKWSSSLKQSLSAGTHVEFEESSLRRAIYRPFCSQNLYLDETLVHRPALIKVFFPNVQTEFENTLISVSGAGADHQTFYASGQMVDVKCGINGNSTVQCFPFYVYSEDGANRRENITDWSLRKFREHYETSVQPSAIADDTDKTDAENGSEPPAVAGGLDSPKNPPATAGGSDLSGKPRQILKRDIFHYVYAILHHPVYREKYAANLKRELPRVPLAPDFWAFADVGERLADLHVNYETQKEYPLEQIENPSAEFTLQVEKMRLSKDKSELRYNEFLTLRGIPPQVYEYRLGNRSALEWIVEQYQTTTDQRSGITNDPNRADDPNYILRLVGQIITVSLETVQIVKTLAASPIN